MNDKRSTNRIRSCMCVFFFNIIWTRIIYASYCTLLPAIHQGCKTDTLLLLEDINMVATSGLPSVGKMDIQLMKTLAKVEGFNLHTELIFFFHPCRVMKLIHWKAVGFIYFWDTNGVRLKKRINWICTISSSFHNFSTWQANNVIKNSYLTVSLWIIVFWV